MGSCVVNIIYFIVFIYSIFTLNVFNYSILTHPKIWNTVKMTRVYDCFPQY